MRQRSFYFSDGQYLQLQQSLCHDLTKAGAFVQLMGSAKSGKSALCETLTLYLRRKGHDVVYIDYPIESPEMLRSVLAQNFSLPNVNNVARQLDDAFLTNFEKPKLLIFDDAHQLSDITLLEIHRMAEVQASSKRVSNVLLCGEQELDTRLLNKKELNSLLLNVSRKYLLKPMDKETLSQFFVSYVAQKGLPGKQLSQDALALLYRTSKGYPGPATLLAELVAQSVIGNSSQGVITKAELAAQIKDSDIQQGLPSAELFNVSQLRVLGPIAAVFTIAAVGFLFSIISSEDSDVPLDQASLASTNSGSPFSTTSSSTPTSTSQIETNDATDSRVAAFSIEEAAGEPAHEIIRQASRGTASNPILEPARNAQLVNRGPALPIPSLLRPASVFSLDDEEYEEPVSYSGLALVTAAEIGLAVNTAAETADVGSGPSIAIDLGDSSVENSNQEPVLVVMQNTEPGLALDAAVLAGEDVSANSLMAIDEAVTETDAVELFEEKSEEQLEAQTQAQAEQLSHAAPAATDTIQVNTIADSAVVAVPENIDVVDLENQSLSSVVIQLDQAMSTDTMVRARVESWVSAWQQQSLEGYFASYSSEFEPRYDTSVARWRASRTRVIGNAQWIRLTLNEYEIIEESPNSIEVHFWLDYESPTYSDSTKKKLVLGNGSGGWEILEEINLQVRT
ncbi:MAG: type II secretory pathway predicted ATPase ExeA [Pseudohongiellaceae bacterium]|jgi:type II secretory pathway predicted ATPase ExeA